MTFRKWKEKREYRNAVGCKHCGSCRSKAGGRGFLVCAEATEAMTKYVTCRVSDRKVCNNWTEPTTLDTK